MSGGDPQWRAKAACRGKLHLFFGRPTERRPQIDRREAEALALCATCPVLSECRSWAREHREHGIWGGETELDRARAGFGTPHYRG